MIDEKRADESEVVQCVSRHIVCIPCEVGIPGARYDCCGVDER